jgi:hypothetical protein
LLVVFPLLALGLSLALPVRRDSEVAAPAGTIRFPRRNQRQPAR